MPLAFKSYSDLLSLVNNVNGTKYNRFGKLIGVDYSSTSLPVSTGTKVLVLDGTNGNDRDYPFDELVLLTAKTGATATMLARVLLFTPNNRALSVNVLSVTGSGTGTQWRITRPTPRVDFHPETLVARGVRIEPTSTNLFLNNNLTTPALVPAGTTHAISTDVVNIEGNRNSRKFTITTAGNVRFGDSVSGVSGRRYVGSVFIRTAAGLEGVNVPKTVTADFNDVGSVNYNIDSTKWYRIFATGATANTLRFLDITLPVGEYYLDAVQIEENFQTPTSPIPTRATVEARSTDIIKALNTTVLPVNSEYTVIVQAEHEVFPEDDALAYSIASISDATASNIISLQLNNQAAASYAARVSVVTAGTAVYSFTYPNASFVSGANFRFGVVIKQNNFISAFNNTLGDADTTGNIPTVNQFWIGSTNGTLDQWRGWISEFFYYPRALSNTELLEATDTLGTPLIFS